MGRPTPWVATPALEPLRDRLAPAGLEVQATAEGIVLTWPPGSDSEGTVAVYRRIDGNEVPPERVALVERSEGRYLDESVITGAKYEYRLRMLLSEEEPRREGSDGATRVQLAEDLFAPDTPGGLVAVQEGAAIRLFWNPNDEPDLAGYVVYRKAAGGDWVPLMQQAIQDTTWLDESAPEQVELEYRITAVDKTTPTNESSPSAAGSDYVDRIRQRRSGFVSGSIPFWKMSGAGNDFIVIDQDARERLGADLDVWIRAVTRRGLSLGSDGVLIVAPVGKDRLRVEFRNPDASAAFCGNGSRCAARYGFLRNWISRSAQLDTAAGALEVELCGETGTQVILALEPPKRLGSFPGSKFHVDIKEPIDWIDAGTPHVILRVADAAKAPLEEWGPILRHHSAFGAGGTNVNLVAPARQEGTWSIRTWEKGVETETLACGSGALAAGYALRLDSSEDWINLLPTGNVPLGVRLAGPRDSPSRAWLRGDARVLARGQVDREAI